MTCEAFSSTPTELYAYTALMNPGDQIIGLDLAHRGQFFHSY